MRLGPEPQLDAVYVDVRDARAVVSVRPKAAFEAVITGSLLLSPALLG